MIDRITLAIVALSVSIVIALVVLLVYSLCFGKKETPYRWSKTPSWQGKEVPSFIPNHHLPGTFKPYHQQPNQIGRYKPISTSSDEEECEPFSSEEEYCPNKLPDIPEDQESPQTSEKPSRDRKRWPVIDRIQPPPVDQTSGTTRSLSLRYNDGKVAELILTVAYKESALILTVKEICKIHPSINKSSAYVRVKNHRERKLSIPTMLYSKNMGTLLGSHSYRFVMPKESIENSRFTFYLWSTDRHSREKEFGECVVQFTGSENRDYAQGYIAKYDFFIYDTEPRPGDPSITLKLKYSNRSTKMIVCVKDIKDLKPTKTMGFVPNVWVKILFHKTNIDKKMIFKTKKFRDLNPAFNQTFSYDVSLEEIEHLVIRLEIFAKHFQKECLSVLELSSNSTGRLAEHWRQMGHTIISGQEIEMIHRISQDTRRPRARELPRRFSNFIIS